MRRALLLVELHWALDQMRRGLELVRSAMMAMVVQVAEALLLFTAAATVKAVGRLAAERQRLLLEICLRKKDMPAWRSKTR